MYLNIEYGPLDTHSVLQWHNKELIVFKPLPLDSAAVLSQKICNANRIPRSAPPLLVGIRYFIPRGQYRLQIPCPKF